MPIPVINKKKFQWLITCEERALTAIECLSMPPLKTSLSREWIEILDYYTKITPQAINKTWPMNASLVPKIKKIKWLYTLFIHKYVKRIKHFGRCFSHTSLLSNHLVCLLAASDSSHEFLVVFLGKGVTISKQYIPKNWQICWHTAIQ